MPFVWKNELSVGINDIDTQHKNFIEIMNEVFSRYYTLKIGNELMLLLDKLYHFAEFHFSTEEFYFEHYNYEFKEEHIKEHRKLKQEIQSFINRCQNGEEIVTELIDFLESWLVDHLEGHDKKYAKIFAEKGYINNNALDEKK